WAPVELQVDVRVTPVGVQGGRSPSPSPSPSTRFLTVPVPESPASVRRAVPPFPALAAPPSPLAGPADRPPASPLGRCRCCRDQYPDKKEEAALLPRADGTELPRAIALLGLPMYMKSLRWALAIMAILLAVSVVTIIVLIAGAGTRCRLCPEGWMWAEDQCLYLSMETRAWEAGQAFCSAQHATLPLLNHTQSILTRHYMALHSWVGAWHSHRGWHWINRVPMLPQISSPPLPRPWEDKELRCGALEEGKLVALNCTTPRPWVCVRAPK
ncbi:killer cell lectin-like receptor subfamily G member 2, partial [Echinops telfairi]|uniref:Killer cell lectin-like receptor subfamily G member 2 n=1 Tax=Echinops telfairi TaxID=9371 RepID=A0ABM1VJJ0_ECHTE